MSEPASNAVPRRADGAMIPPGIRSKMRRAHNSDRRSFNLYVLAPIMVIVVSAMIALIGGTIWLTALQNRAEELREIEHLDARLKAEIAAVEATTNVFAVWDDAARRLIVEFDRAWADVNFGGYFYDNNGIEAAFIVDQAGRALYGYVDGKRSLADPVAVLGEGYAGAVAQIVNARRGMDGPLGGITISARGTAMFSVMRIRPHAATLHVPTSVHRYAVLAKFIDHRVLQELAGASHSAELSLTRLPRPGFLSWTVAAFDGQGSRSFNWRPDEPGTRLLDQAIPWLMVLICMMGILGGLVLTRARKVARELVASETKALYLASRDPLTGLPNRRSFTAHLLNLSRRKDKYSVLFLDLDGFKRVNDTFGHAVGDKVLCRTAERLQRVLPPGAFLARLGGDEFSIALDAGDSPADLDGLVARLIAAVGEPYRFGGEPTAVGVSIGIADDGDDEEIVRRADTAMYAAKLRGRNNWQHYEPGLDAGREERRRLECDLKRALARREIFVVFQPIVDAHSHRICAVEALARWTHPAMGPISPDIFISIAEESGLIVELGKQILEQACVAARHWPFRLAVNLSPAQFWQHDLVDEVIETLDRCKFPASRLKFEITETYLLRRPEAAEAVIKALRRRGVRIALDDFGTGYASIGYLRRFEFDLVKIDRSLVEAVVTDAAAAEVFFAIVSLCRALKLPILAEGVESADQAAMLTGNGCAYLQGWHFGRPMLPAQVDALVARRRVA